MSRWQHAEIALDGRRGVLCSPKHSTSTLIAYWGLDARNRIAQLVVEIDDWVASELVGRSPPRSAGSAAVNH